MLGSRWALLKIGTNDGFMQSGNDPPGSLKVNNVCQLSFKLMPRKWVVMLGSRWTLLKTGTNEFM